MPKTENKFTPPPYSYSGIAGDHHLMARHPNGGKMTVAILVGNPAMKDGEFEANKKFVATAVNSHAALVTALKALADRIRDSFEDNKLDWTELREAEYTQARSALKLAGEEI